MNRRLRAGWVRFILLLALVAGGGAAGLYLVGACTEERLDPGALSPPGSTEPNRPPAAPPRFTHRFALSALDVKNQNEAADVAADTSGRVFLTWASKTSESERTVFFCRSGDAGQTFDAPTVVAKGDIFRSKSKRGGGYERAATPHLAFLNDRLHLSWSQGTQGGKSMRLMLATSTDAGSSFASAAAVDQNEGANPTFTAMAGGGNRLACTWLGGDAQQVFAAVRGAGSDAFTQDMLVHAGEEGNGVCPCCPTGVCIAPDGTVFVAFRNIASGYRDIAIAHLRPGQDRFSEPKSIVSPTWKFSGCPHDGPALAVVGEDLHVVWMDAHTGSGRCYHSMAKLSDMTFQTRELHPISAGTQGNAKLHVDSAGRLHAVWEQSAEAPPPGTAEKHQHGGHAFTPGSSGRAIYHAVFGPDNKWTAPQAVAPQAGAFQTRPAVTVTPTGQVVVAFSELDEKGKSIVVCAFDREVRP